MSEPVAIVGMACRFPGAPGPDAYWQLLRSGVEAVREPPIARPELEPPAWLADQAPLSRRGGFLEGLDRFDAGFFRISPREAARMDPQQRLMLEVAWEALEDAGQPASALAGSASGVFVGVMNADFARRHASDLTRIDAQLGPGSSLAIVANRLSFFLDLRGPSLSVDTLCSSSLVAVHLACQSLLNDESMPLALAGGVNVILDRTMDVFYARAGLLAADGHCRAFDARASGIVRGEGAALVVLKRLSRAVADGDRVHALILGSAVNQDGRSNGLTSPSRWSQEAVLRAAYQRAGVAPGAASYVETHGTGTLIGDPIETAALNAVLSDDRADGEPCAIGSVKTNLGHLESAAGIASLIKTVLCLRHRTLVPSLNFDTPNPYLRLNERTLRVVTRPQPWNGTDLVAGVSSFGMGGTNAHIVLGGANVSDVARQRPTRAALIPISARSAAAVDSIERQVLSLISVGEADLADVAYTCGLRRDHHDRRRALLVGDTGELSVSMSGRVVPGRQHHVAFVLPREVDCNETCGAELAVEEPIFRQALQQHLDEGQPRLAAVQAALDALWRSWGVIPDAVAQVSDDLSALRGLLGSDATVFVELSPRPTLIDMRAVLEQAGTPGVALSSFRPGMTERQSMLRAAGELYCLGIDLNWRQLTAPDARFVPLGSYPWQREHSWLEPPMPLHVAVASAAPSTAASKPSMELLVPNWLRRDAERGTSRVATGPWVVVGRDDVVGAVASGLERTGQHVHAAESISGSESRPAHVVSCGGDLVSTIKLVQQLAARTGGVWPRLWLVTRGACVVATETTLDALNAATVWGFARVVANEFPRLRCTLVDLPAAIGPADIASLVDELLANGLETEVAIRGRERFVARLERAHPAAPSRPRLRADAAYVVTGGLGSLGLAAARRLVECGAKTLVLVGRRDVANEATRSAVDDLTQLGAAVTVERADVSDRSALEAIWRRHTVRGVVHAAGVMTPAMVPAIDPAAVASAIAAKVEGARHLHELTADQPLDFFMLYSSVAALLGMPGQGAYAAGNAYLDALASYRRRHGLPATSIAWTAITGTAMAADAKAREIAQLTDRGVGTLSVAQATDAFEQLLAAERPANVGVVRFDIERWRTFYPHAKSVPRLQLLDGEAPAAASKRLLVDDVRGLAASERTARIGTLLAESVATVMHEAGAIDLDRSLIDYGLDSLTSIELRSMIEDSFAIEMDADLLLRGPSIKQLAAEIATRLGGTTGPMSIARSSLRIEPRLDPAIRFTPRAPGPPADLLLTGATGFLGAFVLAELLARTDATIHCLVRAASAGQAMERLETALSRYKLPALDLRARVQCVLGDLTQPNLGLAAADVNRLAGSLDTIVHSGASVNFVFPYEALEAGNVGGTHEVLRLAGRAGARLHYVSTIGVFPGGVERSRTIFEGDAATEPEALTLGYMQTKWAAEALVRQGIERGLVASIYRPSTITSHSVSGVFNPDDFFCALIKGCIELEVAPDVDVPVNLVPVDYVSRALVELAVADPRAAGAYHLVDRQAVPWNDIVEWVRQLGYRLAVVSYPEWRALLLARAVASGNALAPLLPLFADHDETDWLRLPPFDDARARRRLEGTNISCPPTGELSIRRSIEAFVVQGYLPRPFG